MRQTRVRRMRRKFFFRSSPRHARTHVALMSSALLLSAFLMPASAWAQSPVTLSGYTLTAGQTAVTLTGQNFGSSPATVTIDGHNATVTSWNSQSITVSVPAQAGPGPIIVDTSSGLSSNAITFAGVSRGSYALASDGSVTAQGNVPFYGDLQTIGATAAGPAVQLVPTPGYAGYWILTHSGQVFAFGNAATFSQTMPSSDGQALAMAVTPSGSGAFVLTSSGTVFPMGNADNYGNIPANLSPVSIASSPSGLGYWILSAQGVVSAFGDAASYGSLPQATNTASPSYPNGTLLRQTGTSAVWLVENGTAQHIPSAAIFLGMGLEWSQIQTIPQMSGLSLGAPLVTPFPSGTLLRAAGQSAIYLVMQGVLRHIASWSVFTQMGFSAARVQQVSQISGSWPQGPALTTPVSYYPSGTLLRQTGTPSVYMVQNGTLEHVMSASVLLGMGYSWNQVQDVPSLPGMPAGAPLSSPARAFPTGTLLEVSGQPAIYLVQTGVLRHIPSAQVLENLGFTFSDVIKVSSLPGLPTGPAMDSSVLPANTTGNVQSPGTASPAIALTATQNGQGYWILQSDGTVTPFGDAQGFGEPSGAIQSTGLVVSFDQRGYDVLTNKGQALPFGDAPPLSVPTGTLSAVETPLPAPAAVPAPVQPAPSQPAPTLSSTGFLSMGYGFFVDNFPNGVDDSSYSDLLQHASDLSAINPAWFNLVQNPDGSWQITSWSTQGADAAPAINGLNNIQTVTAQAHKEGVAVLPSIGNYYDPASGPISSAADDSSLVSQIVSLVNQNGFDGITIDFENDGEGGMTLSSASQQYTNFIEQLGTALHSEGKLLMVAVYPSAYPNTVYNYTALSPYVNYINMMAYPEDNASTEPGPTAGYPWVASLVQAALSAGVPPQQIILGIAPYGHEWTVTNQGITGVGAVSNRAVQALLQQQGITPMWDPAQQELVFSAGPQAPLPPAGLSEQTEGTSVPAVANLQNLLNLTLLEYAIKNNQTPPAWLTTDGDYGPDTMSAVSTFQQDFQVQGATAGVYDTATANALQQVITQWNIGQNIYWDENSAATTARVQLAMQDQLGGVTAWRLPFETANYWSDLSNLGPVSHDLP